jgi:hypothetical protein
MLLIIVSHLKTVDNPSRMLKQGTLKDMLDISRRKDSGMVVNALDCPMGSQSGRTAPTPLRFSALASDDKATAVTQGAVGLEDVDLSDKTTWGLAATKNATSWVHVDDDGFATMVSVETGSKYWALGRRRQAKDKASKSGDDMSVDTEHDASGDLGGDMSTTHAYSDTFEPSGPYTDVLDYEAVLLRPGSLL